MILFALMAPVWAEGSADLGDEGAILHGGAEVYVDIVDPATEYLVIDVPQSAVATVTDASGGVVGTIEGSGTRGFTAPGTYTVVFDDDISPDWDLTVEGAPPNEGRVHATSWHLSATANSPTSALTGSFFVVRPISEGVGGVVEIDFQGLSGDSWYLGANDSGLDAPHAGESAFISAASFAPAYSFYLNPPDAPMALPKPAVRRFAHADDACEGAMALEATSAQRYHIVCDTDQDGLFDITGGGDWVEMGALVDGAVSVAWDGRDGDGRTVADGAYACRARVTSGELHLIAVDVMTAFPGLRTFAMTPTGVRLPLLMFWNDRAVQDKAVDMPLGAGLPLETSGPEGVDPGDEDDLIVANENARAWGAFGDDSKGNGTYLDTTAWLDDALSEELTLQVVDGRVTCSAGQGYFQNGCAVVSGRAVRWLWLPAAVLLLLRRRRA